ncbi:MAG: toll/interleukin-1 receptor domain-containing protein [Lachnospiraceae bacterium]|nr:toll/interleukin-1 receptor domain-containing protein [Lachnospiraceae bacterium]
MRTLCLIGEIYDAAGRLDRCKEMLERAYNRSSVGRTVLYRLVEVTTELGQYDEALKYYSEYVQIAPNDNNRFILKYRIYKGAGSSAKNLIPILEEYLEQEHAEKWAYELATLYQQAGQIQECLSMCDNLVLWFHSGKYVKKALELKKRYAKLTPKQQKIYDACMHEDVQNHYSEGDECASSRSKEETDGDVLAENINSQAEKEIAEEKVYARKAEKKKEPLSTQALRSAAAEKGVPSKLAEGRAKTEDGHKSITASNADVVNTKEKYVFISYSSKNQRIADSVRFMLLEKGVPCWMAPYDIPAGSKYAYVINDALENCACLLLLLSNASQNSQFVEREIERAISYKKAIIPMQLEELELNSGFKFYIGNCQIISVPEIRENSPEFDRILKGINCYL